MRWVTLSHFAKVFLLLAFLTGMQLSIALTAPLAAGNVAQHDGSAIASQCHHCDKAGTVAVKCHMVCAPVFAINPDNATVLPAAASPLRHSYVVAKFGRVVRPSLAPPRLPNT